MADPGPDYAPCVGLSKKRFKLGAVNTIVIYGGDLKRHGKPPKTTKVDLKTSSGHTWTNPATIKGHDPHYLHIEAMLNRGASGPKRGYDDLTVTVTYDEGLATEETTVMRFDDPDM